MHFYVKGYVDSHNIPEQNMDIFPHVRLVTDDFDDYGNQTLFRMYFAKKRHTPEVMLGKVKILHSQISKTREALPVSFEKLDQEFCSLGQSVDYYYQLRELNGERAGIKFGEDILAALNDIAIHRDLREKFPDNNGILNSLMRDSEAYHAYKLGHNVYYGISSHIQDKISFTYTFDKKEDKKVRFEFNDDSGLPNRINVVVGKNGTGKTKMLSTLAGVLSGYCKNEELYEVDQRPGFSRYIAVSYSAFDNFEKPFGEKFSKREYVEESAHIVRELKKQRDKCQTKA